MTKSGETSTQGNFEVSVSSKLYEIIQTVQEIINHQSTTFDHKTNLLSRVSLAEINTYMQNVLLRDTDQMSMAHALEVRVPFLDHKLVEYVINVPDKYKDPVTPKKLLIDSIGNLIPKEIIDRPKMGFLFPWSTWLKNELKIFCEQSLVSLFEREPFNKEEGQILWNRFLHNDPHITWSRIWILVVLETWLINNSIET